MFLLFCTAQAIKATWIDLTVCMGLRGCPIALIQDVTWCSAWESTHVYIKPIQFPKWKREIERILKSVFLSDSVHVSLCSIARAWQYLLLTCRSAEVTKSFMHYKEDAALCFLDSNLFSLGVFPRPDLESLRGWYSFSLIFGMDFMEDFIDF